MSTRVPQLPAPLVGLFLHASSRADLPGASEADERAMSERCTSSNPNQMKP